PRLVNVDPPARQHGHAVLGLELPVAVRGAKRYGEDLGVALLEREVVVTAGCELEAGDFTGDADIVELAVKHPADGGIELADREHAPHRSGVETKFKSELLHVI